MTLRELIHQTRQELAATGLDRLPDGRASQLLEPRGVRFLRQAGVVSPPEGHGPGAVWDRLHIEQILTCRALQAAGLTVAQAAETLRGRDREALRRIREKAVQEARRPIESDPVRLCLSWQLSPDFLLVSPTGRALSPAVLSQIQQLLASRSS